MSRGGELVGVVEEEETERLRVWVSVAVRGREEGRKEGSSLPVSSSPSHRLNLCLL